jgi:integrase
MSGQIIKRGVSTWLVRVYLGRDGGGKRRYHNRTIHGSRREARKYIELVRAEVHKGTSLTPTRCSVSQYLDRWLDTSARPRVRPNTLDSYNKLLRRYIIPALGTRRLASLGSSEIQAVYGSLSDRGLSPRTIRYVHAVFHAALTQAVKWGELPKNPVASVQVPRVEFAERIILNIDEARRFLATAESDKWYPLWLLLLTTGLRPSEALALKWSDFQGKRLSVRRSIDTSSRDSQFRETKTSRSRREVTLPAATVSVLLTHRSRQAEAVLSTGSAHERLDLIFANEIGNPLYYPHLVRRHFKAVLAKAGLPDIRVYDLRHTHATHLLAHNVHPKIVADRLGHASTAMTMDVYSHVLPSMQDGAAESVADLFKRD